MGNERELSSKTRVFHLIKGLGVGGAETLLSEGLAKADRSEFDYGFGYFLPWKGQLVSALEDQGAEVFCFDAKNPLSLLLSVNRVARLLSDWKADLVHCHLPLSGVVGRLAGKKAGIPVVYTEHNLQERYHPLTRWANRATWAKQDLVLAVSGEVKSSIGRRLNRTVPVRRVVNGIRVDSFSRNGAGPKVRESLGIPLDARVVGNVAVFRKQKRLDVWLEIARNLAGQHPDLHFVLVGDGPRKQQVLQLARELELDNLHVVGFQDSVLPYLSAMDVFLISSEHEGLPLALLEAMACEVPVVSTPAGGIPEVIDEGVTGFLCGTPSASVEAVTRLLLDDAFRLNMGKRARRRVVESFSMDLMARNLESIYREVLGRTVVE